MNIQKNIEKLKEDIRALEESKKYLSNDVSILALDHFIHHKRKRIKFLIEHYK